MPVPNSMADLATIASSNFPTGTEAVGNGLDNYLRAGFSILRSTNAVASSTIASASTTDIVLADAEAVIITGTSTINNLGTGFVGCKRELRFQSALNIVHSSSIVLPGSVNLAVQAADVWSFRCVGSGVWVLTGGMRDSRAVLRAGDTMSGALDVAFTNAFITLTDTATSLKTRLVTSGNQTFLEPPSNGTLNIRGFGGTGTANVAVTGKVTAVTSFISSTGDVVVAPTSATGFIYLRPKGEFDGSAQITVDFGGNLTATGNLTANSDERLKYGWKGFAPDFLDSLAGVKRGSYTRLDSGAEQVGVSAQSLQRVLPQAVQTDSDGLLSVAYGNAALVAAIELAGEVVALRGRVAKLEGA